MNKEQFIALGLTEELAKKAESESLSELKNYIPKTRFDEVNTAKKQLENDIKDRDKQLEDLKINSGNSEELKKQIETLQEENKNKDIKYQEELQDLKLSNAIKLSISGKVHDEELAAGLFDKSKLILGDDGKVAGIEEQLKIIQESKKFLFKEEKQSNPKSGFKFGSDGGSNIDNSNQPSKLSMKDAIQAKIQSQMTKQE
ncbi:TPA: phage scaffolding protein [Clostridioides difficile]|uniref:phage scaffolding protein n=1 Tax=Clostridioides difficile TaxID=1496 RepID=UPI001C1CF394|nr:phage scaffolding protein [Clostridioides difficile]MDV9710574.1 phage scaffolding protein [Clostridioides difficile]UUC40669.1 phage scaffolding protein [Clostridioides difficile]HBF5147637.1 phage scaffolding protein [Clostridioides difficile]HBF6468896.1 phage scaffolding protein [Clostridioides difficile]HBH3651444.1 phage scaffolding protein [Clostridioides difficile]